MGPSERSESRLCGREGLKDEMQGQRARRCLTWSTPVIPWSCPLCWTGGLDLYPRQMPHCRSPAGRCPGCRYSACQPRSSGWIQHCLVTQSRDVTTHLCNSSASGRAWNDETIRCWPLGLATEFPCCLRLASLNMSITRVANSCALNLASFCRPWNKKSKVTTKSAASKRERKRTRRETIKRLNVLERPTCLVACRGVLRIHREERHHSCLCHQGAVILCRQPHYK